MSRVIRSFVSSDAKRSEVPLHIGIMSPSGGGKTYSALRLATGMQKIYGGDIYGLDTEASRMLFYADKFKFKHVPFAPPFGSMDYLDAVRYCYNQGARVIVVDSMTHEHIGQNGYLETANEIIEQAVERKRKTAEEKGWRFEEYKAREAAQMQGWAKAGPLRQSMIEGLKQMPGCFIYCFRAKEKVKPIKKDGKTEVIDMGFMPIAGEDWVYEMAMNCMLEPRSDGVPTWRSDHVGERLMMKLPDQFRTFLTDSEGRPLQLSEEIGRKLAEWAKGGAAAAKPSPEPDNALLDAGMSAAQKGEKDYDAWIKTLTSPQKKQLAESGSGADMRKIAKAADEVSTTTDPATGTDR